MPGEKSLDGQVGQDLGGRRIPPALDESYPSM